MSTEFLALHDAVAKIGDGSQLAFSKLYPMALVRELVRQRKRGLAVVGVPIAGLGVDLLVAAGVAASVESGAVTLGAQGPAANFWRALQAGEVRRIESSCSVIVGALTAGATGFPFVPVPGVLGSSLLDVRDDFIVTANPYDPAGDVVVVPALRPDFALIHALGADEEGNLLVSGYGDEALLARAARTTIATVEIVSPDALARITPGSEVIPAAYVDYVVHAPGSTHPFGGVAGRTDDAAALRRYVEASRSRETIEEYVEHVIRASRDETDYLAKAGERNAGV